MNSRAAIALVFALGLGVAAAAGFALATRPAETAPAPAAAIRPEQRIALAEYDSRLRELDQSLARERDRRVALEAEVGELRRRIDERKEIASARTDRRRASRTEGSLDHDGHERRPEERARGVDVQALVDAGFPPQQVRAFKEKMDQIELDRLYLRDLAAREGWLDTPRFHEENLDLGDVVRQAREELGDEFYDWMLYTSGHPNRVRVGDVLEGSAAAAAGLRPGDLILSYDQQRIFSPSELRDSTTTGTAGDTTALSVLRNGHEVQVDVPRGPLGVRVDFATEQPPRAG
jgi:predicted metalloprotease with PDZ domain